MENEEMEIEREGKAILLGEELFVYDCGDIQEGISHSQKNPFQTHFYTEIEREELVGRSCWTGEEVWGDVLQGREGYGIYILKVGFGRSLRPTNPLLIYYCFIFRTFTTKILLNRVIIVENSKLL